MRTYTPFATKWTWTEKRAATFLAAYDALEAGPATPTAGTVFTRMTKLDRSLIGEKLTKDIVKSRLQTHRKKLQEDRALASA